MFEMELADTLSNLAAKLQSLLTYLRRITIDEIQLGFSQGRIVYEYTRVFWFFRTTLLWRIRKVINKGCYEMTVKLSKGQIACSL